MCRIAKNGTGDRIGKKLRFLNDGRLLKGKKAPTIKPIFSISSLLSK